MPRLTVTGTNIDAPDANALADFYRRLLGWTTSTEEPGWGAGAETRPVRDKDL
jgi:predicted enzyme related to lactoylglutathione lyase